jgi:glutamyl-tRNA synthetase
MREIILKWALKNAVDHDGKAMAGAVISKAIGEDNKLKNDMKKLGTEVAKTVAEVNAMDIAEQIAALEKMAPHLLEKKETKYELPELPNAKEGQVVMMFPPEPSKFPQIGHARACWLNYYYAKKYDGKFTIRFEDTNANKVKKEYYEEMLNGFKWLGVVWDKVDYISDHIDKMYEYAEKLISKDKAYMCNCPTEKVRELRAKEEACMCRDNLRKENLALWKDMLSNKFKEGEYSLRAKIDMKHKNAAMRDPAIMRTVIGTHPRVGDKYLVWPNYDFATAIMDKIEGITHRLRGKEFEMRAEIQQWIQKELKMKSPVIIEFARSNLEGVPASGRIIREGIASGQFIGWDDPRLPTLIALQRRGFQPEAIRNFIVNLGLTKAESVIQWNLLEAENRKVIESIANRYFMVREPIEMIVKKAPENLKAKVKLHPDKPERGFKEYEFKGNEIHVFVDKHDLLNKKQDDKFRLMDLCNIKLEIMDEEKITAHFESKEMQPGIKIIHWVPVEGAVDIEILMADGEIYYGTAESAINDLKVNDVIQFIRFGFCRLDEKRKTLKFRFTHT